MSTDAKPTIVVAGSLSKQGRSVTESLLGSGRYH
ncbi:NmrA/HSCARG family protein, partial [Rhizobium leguminosarum bv. viciae]